MRYSRFSVANASFSKPYRVPVVRKLVILLYCSLLVCLLAACGTTTSAANNPTPPRPTPTFTPTPTPTPTPSPTPTPTPKPTPKPTLAPTLPPPPPPPPTLPPHAPPPPPPPPAGPAFLNVTPSSMSIVGRFDCSKSMSVFVCHSSVFALASNRTTLHWVAFANIGGVGFAPAQGNLGPGAQVFLTITIPIGRCSGTFFFQGPANTHTIGWAC